MNFSILSRRKQRRQAEESSDLSGRLVTLLDHSGTAAEDYRTLRTNLLYSAVDDPPRVLVFTSPGPQEGKSTTCANLGVALAQAGKSTLMLDCDLRKPVAHRIFGLRNMRGVVDALAGTHELSELWTEPLIDLKVIPTGPMPPNPAELLGSWKFAELIETARKQFDYVLIDAPPIGLVADPAIVAPQGDGVLLVLDAQKTRKAALRKAMRSMDNVGANVIGTVMNNVKGGRGGYYQQYGGYGYRYEE